MAQKKSQNETSAAKEGPNAEAAIAEIPSNGVCLNPMGASKNSGMRTQATSARQLPTQNPLKIIPRIPAKAANLNDRLRNDISWPLRVLLRILTQKTLRNRSRLKSQFERQRVAREARIGQSVVRSCVYCRLNNSSMRRTTRRPDSSRKLTRT